MNVSKTVGQVTRRHTDLGTAAVLLDRRVYRRRVRFGCPRDGRRSHRCIE